MRNIIVYSRMLNDNGHNLNRDERRAQMDRAIVLTLDRLVTSGKVGLL